MTKPKRSSSERQELALIKSTVWKYLQQRGSLTELQASLQRLIPEEQVRNLTAALHGRRGLSYRDGVLIQLAYKLINADVDVTKRPKGARTVAQRLARYFMEKNIPAKSDAYQNIAKNSENLVSGNFREFDSFLEWANHASEDQLKAVFEYACAWVAGQARPVPPMPELDPTKLTFARVMEVYDTLIAKGSQGVYEQYIIASLLHGLLVYEGSHYRVETKKVTASDTSTRAAGDIEVFSQGRLIEALEVTAANWQEKIFGVKAKMRGHDLQRMHIVAPLREEYSLVVEEMRNHQEDISVIDLKSAVATLLAALTKPQRKIALHRLYEYLERFQEDVHLVAGYVQVLRDSGLTFD